MLSYAVDGNCNLIYVRMTDIILRLDVFLCFEFELLCDLNRKFSCISQSACMLYMSVSVNLGLKIFERRELGSKLQFSFYSKFFFSLNFEA